MRDQLTIHQRELARHALGLPNRKRLSYRNHYVIGPGGPDHDAWMAMVAAGAAHRRVGGPLTGGGDLFFLTKVGAQAVLDPRERLDPEDFPEANDA